MKKILVSLLIFTSIAGQAMTQDRDPVQYERTINFSPEWTKAKVFDASIIWLASNFENPNDVLVYKNMETGMIVGNAEKIIVEGKGLSVSARTVRYTFVIDVFKSSVKIQFIKMKENLGQYGFIDLNINYKKFMDGSSPWPQTDKKFYDALNDYMIKGLDSFESGINIRLSN